MAHEAICREGPGRQGDADADACQGRHRAEAPALQLARWPYRISGWRLANPLFRADEKIFCGARRMKALLSRRDTLLRTAAMATAGALFPGVAAPARALS